MPILSAGEKLGPYEVIEPLGSGGMGEVWKARDTRLNRFVAIKRSQANFSDRFSREAQAIAALNHPHICQLYDVGPDYLVMEYVEGKPLAGPLPVAKAIDYARQICGGLEAAHLKGIVHRDLKPGNILVGKAGVKILDFGLAKMESEQRRPDDATVTVGVTGVGMLVGTPQYMAPEQFEGQQADARSDIFAFGLILYEMLSGKRPFNGATQASLIASVLKEQPRPLHEIEPLMPIQLERIVNTCLEKDPEQRWQSAREIRHALDWIEGSGPSSGTPPSASVNSTSTSHTAGRPALTATHSKTSRLWPVVSAFLAVALATMMAWVLWPKPEPPQQVTRFQIHLPNDVTFGQYLAVSPDGAKIVFNGSGEHSGLWIHDLENLEWRHLEGTEGAQSPFWSPDSRYLAFGVQNDLKKIDITGGAPQTLCSISTLVGSGAWSKEGVIVFGSRPGPLRRISASGGVPTDLTVLDVALRESVHSLPTFLPDGKHFLYFRLAEGPENTGEYAGSVDMKPSDPRGERLLASRYSASLQDGNLFFVRDGTLMTQPFNAKAVRLTGEPVPVAERIGIAGSTGIFSVSGSGSLAYRAGAGPALRSQPTWFDRQGKVQETLGSPGSDRGFVFSPDGSAVGVRDAQNPQAGDIWRIDLMRGVRTRLTFRRGPGSPPVWSPDGSRIAFSYGSRFDTLYEKPSNGAGAEIVLDGSPNVVKYPYSWSRDGRFLLFHTENVPKTGADLWVLPLDGERKPVQLLATEFNELLATFSPDMRWIAYVSNESGRNEVYVRPFNAAGPSLGEGRWQVSKDGAFWPRWRADGKELLFSGSGGQPMTVQVTVSGNAFQPGAPKELFPAPPGWGEWALAPDGKRILAGIAPVQTKPEEPITVILNWRALLKR